MNSHKGYGRPSFLHSLPYSRSEHGVSSVAVRLGRDSLKSPLPVPWLAWEKVAKVHIITTVPIGKAPLID